MTALDLGLAHGTPWFCGVCEEAYDTANMTIQTVDYPDVFVCDDCVEEAGGLRDEPV
jgi:hypothetical protein